MIFNEALNVWRPCMVEGTAANKQNAAWFIANLIPSGNTATYDALKAAFRFDAEAIYLVTDGEPTNGRIVAPPAIVSGGPADQPQPASLDPCDRHRPPPARRPLRPLPEDAGRTEPRAVPKGRPVVEVAGWVELARPHTNEFKDSNGGAGCRHPIAAVET